MRATDRGTYIGSTKFNFRDVSAQNDQVFFFCLYAIANTHREVGLLKGLPSSGLVSLVPDHNTAAMLLIIAMLNIMSRITTAV